MSDVRLTTVISWAGGRAVASDETAAPEFRFREQRCSEFKRKALVSRGLRDQRWRQHDGVDHMDDAVAGHHIRLGDIGVINLHTTISCADAEIFAFEGGGG